MYLLYLDESGSVPDPNQQYFVLAGVSVFERDAHWIEQQLNSVLSRFTSDTYSLELHGSPMRTGSGSWRSYSKDARLEAIRDALRLGVLERSSSNVRLFGAVIKKSSVSGQDIVELAFEQLTSRFDLFLKRLHRGKNTQRGLILLDKSSTEHRIQALAREFKYGGHRWGLTRNYAEVPVFLDSRASRLIQLADLVAFALFRFYEHGDDSFYNVIKHRFDSEGGVEHGLYVRV
ncbi:DUF3800 domain-containing protein [Xylella fastidiosa subsp. sandyi]|uniref:DUF3800 domain-containing protein n=1 Tax=Xylella fastidiosa subsp. fastidiosa TaxID=644356 RepID=A0AAJ5R276_XYLFS|nr:DUF3800 domain-containing protein [Xylella fastidiosa]RWA43677.1 DUF3800 domain-containing protein [Xylella fastidiosa subsp. sandyi]WCF29234.1 DUF3800 domain-containing protein [Xylella fastidiosa subsp. fastidiosa]WNY20013.1 DUF3800 domain-containing protein [Xylella fastidiosa]WNY22309.1 DUF3800 domain-containing protein [Xylella fastidiosa]